MIGFRVDANEKIAMGHLMRCIAIAMECRKKGKECIFFLAEDKETGFLRERNIPYRILGTSWDNLEAEEPIIKEVLENEKTDWLVVDTYQATPAYLAYLQNLVPIFYIDDMKKEKYEVSAVLHYIGWRHDQAYQQQYQNTNTIVLEGMQYAPLREEFMEIPMEKGEREKSILITTGGTDTYNIAGRVLEYCRCQNAFAGYIFHVIVGSMNRHEEKLSNMASRNPHILLHKNISNISEYMRRSEVALSAGGSTLLELCTCRIPTVCFSFAENQREFASGLGKLRVVRYVGDVRDSVHIEAEICNQLSFFVTSECSRKEYASRMGRLIDGKGAERIASILCKNS